MLDTTPYSNKLPYLLNATLKDFTGGDCLMVRKTKDKDRLTGKSGQCHLNVKRLVDEQGGRSVSGWLLSRSPKILERGLYIWSFHSVWMKLDGKLLDVTFDKNYAGRDKSIFVPDSTRVPDLIEDISYNNFVVFTDQSYAKVHGEHIGKNLIPYCPYWSDDSVLRLLDISNHSGKYRLITSTKSPNYRRLCDEYEIDFVGGNPVPRTASKYSDGFLPMQIFFDYSLRFGA